MLVLYKCMFIIIAAIQINEKHCAIYFKRVLGALSSVNFDSTAINVSSQVDFVYVTTKLSQDALHME